LLGRGPGFDRAYAMTADLAQSVIIASLAVTGGRLLWLLIDGTQALEAPMEPPLEAPMEPPIRLVWLEGGIGARAGSIVCMTASPASRSCQGGVAGPMVEARE